MLPSDIRLFTAYLTVKGLGVCRGVRIECSLSELVIAVSMGDQVGHSLLEGDAFRLGNLFGLLIVGEGEGEKFTNSGRYFHAFVVSDAQDFFIHLGFYIAIEAAHGRRSSVVEEL